METRPLPIQNRWCIHSYYTLSPYAPDGSGRILLAGADLEHTEGEVLILSSEGDVLDRFGRHKVTPSFWHTGFWQSWSPDGSCVYYQSGSLLEPQVTRRELATGREIRVEGDMEGIPPSGEPGISCSHALLYAAGYGDGRYTPEDAPVPFQARDQHGISRISFDPPVCELMLSTQDVLDRHPQRERLLKEEDKIKNRLGHDEGLTLMTYCVRWNPQGDRFLFYFGNHCVVKERGEPRLAYVFTADRQMEDIHLALDISFERHGVHWSWQPDGEKLIGYGPDPDEEGETCLAEVCYDGTGYCKLSDNTSGGHPSVCPTDGDLLVTDEKTEDGGAVVFLSRRSGRVIDRIQLPKFRGDAEPPGRNPRRVCHHPVFSRDGSRVLCNTLPGLHAVIAQITSPKGEKGA
ncbi:MAG: hypothetical protein ACOC0A_00015 [Planctomycetota bacterium]